ncbi:MAG: outer membrane beta-barrel domain-containing protein [Myxococcales bacterium]|nr:outer membrane beta-barrel domain-containing protein [Myxococcales bacterium]
MAPRAALAQHEEAVAAELERYFARAYAPGPRAIAKRHRVEIGVGAGVVPTDAQRVYVPISGRLAFHITEWLGVEASFSYSFASETEQGAELARSGSSSVREAQLWRLGAALAWSPLDGKLRLGQLVAGFEPYLLGGFGVVSMDALAAIGVEAAIRPEWLVGAGLRVCFARRWLVRLEYRQHLHLRKSAPRGGGLGAAAEFALGFGVLLGG